MRQEKRSKFDELSEKLIPTRVTIMRKLGDFEYVFEIDGFRGERSGQISYKGSEIERIDHLLKSKTMIYSFTTSAGELFVGREPFQVRAIVPENKPTWSLAGYEEIFKLQPRTQKISLPQRV